MTTNTLRPLDAAARDELARKAEAARDTMAYAACRVLDGEMDHEANAIASRAQGEFLHAVSSPAVILALLASVRGAEADTEAFRKRALAAENALADMVVKPTDYGEQDGGFVRAYIIPTGPMHRAIPLLDNLGISVRPGYDGRKTECPDCDGCGWNEGGATLKSECSRCNGSGIIDAARAHPPIQDTDDA